VTVTTAIPARQENHDPDLVSSVNTPYLHYWVSANKLSKGEHLLTANGTVATADGGTVPADHVGWMWDLTVPGNNDHDFYVIADGHAQGGAAVPVLVHNACLEGRINYVVNNPATGQAITDIDRVSDGVLWEEKSALYGDEQWLQRQVGQKFDKYLTARQYLPGYENAPIGFDFTNPRIDPRFREAVTQYVDQLRTDNPTVDIRLSFAS
jgi:hypothetical protein